jgi:hypothetical protein
MIIKALTPIAWFAYLAFADLIAFGIGTSRDFAAFLLLPMLAFPVFLVAVPIQVLICWTFVRQRSMRLGAISMIGLIMLAAAPVLARIGPEFGDRLSVGSWRRANRASLTRLTSRPGVIAAFDSWGIAGMGNDEYLASDPDDKLQDPGRAEAWAKALDLGCEIVHVQRIQAKLFSVVTYNCPIDAAKIGIRQ